HSAGLCRLARDSWCGSNGRAVHSIHPPPGKHDTAFFCRTAVPDGVRFGPPGGVLRLERNRRSELRTMGTMRMTNRLTGSDHDTANPVLGGMTLLVLEVVVPVALANLIEALTIAGYLPEFSVFNLPLYGWAMAVSAAWALVVLNCGPFLATGSGKRKGRE